MEQIQSNNNNFVPIAEEIQQEPFPTESELEVDVGDDPAVETPFTNPVPPASVEEAASPSLDYVLAPVAKFLKSLGLDHRAMDAMRWIGLSGDRPNEFTHKDFSDGSLHLRVPHGYPAGDHHEIQGIRQHLEDMGDHDGESLLSALGQRFYRGATSAWTTTPMGPLQITKGRVPAGRMVPIQVKDAKRAQNIRVHHGSRPSDVFKQIADATGTKGLSGYLLDQAGNAVKNIVAPGIYRLISASLNGGTRLPTFRLRGGMKTATSGKVTFVDGTEKMCNHPGFGVSLPGQRVRDLYSIWQHGSMEGKLAQQRDFDRVTRNGNGQNLFSTEDIAVSEYYPIEITDSNGNDHYLDTEYWSVADDAWVAHANTPASTLLAHKIEIVERDGSHWLDCPFNWAPPTQVMDADVFNSRRQNEATDGYGWSREAVRTFTESGPTSVKHINMLAALMKVASCYRSRSGNTLQTCHDRSLHADVRRAYNVTGMKAMVTTAVAEGAPSATGVVPDYDAWYPSHTFSKTVDPSSFCVVQDILEAKAITRAHPDWSSAVIVPVPSGADVSVLILMLMLHAPGPMWNKQLVGNNHTPSNPNGDVAAYKMVSSVTSTLVMGGNLRVIIVHPRARTATFAGQMTTWRSGTTAILGGLPANQVVPYSGVDNAGAVQINGVAMAEFCATHYSTFSPPCTLR